MEKLELQKIANEVRKESLRQYMLQKQDIRADLCLQQMYSHIYILKK